MEYVCDTLVKDCILIVCGFGVEYAVQKLWKLYIKWNGFSRGQPSYLTPFLILDIATE